MVERDQGGADGGQLLDQPRILSTGRRLSSCRG